MRREKLFVQSLLGKLCGLAQKQCSAICLVWRQPNVLLCRLKFYPATLKATVAL